MTNLPISRKTCPKTHQSLIKTLQIEINKYAAFGKELKAQMRHIVATYEHGSEMSRQNKSGGRHAAHRRWTKTHSERVDAVVAVKLDSLVTFVRLFGAF